MFKGKISFQLSIQSIFITIFVALLGFILYLMASSFLNIINVVAHKLMERTGSAILKNLELEISAAKYLNNLTKELFEKEITDNDEIMNYTLLIAKNLAIHPLPYPARLAAWGDNKGNSIETSLEPDGTYSTAIITHDKSHSLAIRYYRDTTGNIIKQEPIPNNYDPRLRPWYKEAEKAKKPVWSDFFLSYPYNNPSTSYSVPIYDKNNLLLGVFEIEVKLISLSNFLDQLKISPNSFAFIVNDKNQLIAFPGMQKETSQTPITIESFKTTKPWIVDSYTIYKKTHTPYFTFSSQGEHYIAYYQTIPAFSSLGWKMAVVVPENDFIWILKRTEYFLIFCSLVILVLGIIALNLFSKQISKPLKLIVKDTERIKEFDLTENKSIDSHILEIDYLSKSVNTMKTSLRSFQKYVPADLVRKLIHSGKDVVLGGEKSTITTFFSDIRNFTYITEHSNVEALMEHLCEYFEELSNIIAEEKGTVDKYIGDSIMAFWGAPLSDKDHCIHACNAALRCQKRLNELNAQWEKENKPKLITGIGIHTGMAIVGNIGSFSRLNYTAIGDTINMASRLEKMTKEYKVQIVVSEDVVKAVGEKFIFREIDRIEVRGKTGKYTIYELIDWAE